MPLLESATSTLRPPRRAAGLPRLVLVETRKAVDTRASRALLITIAGLSAAVMVGISIYGAMNDSLAVASTVATGITPALILLPIVGILLVTGEWSQRTALVTFALVPQRWRVLLAKILASLLLTVVVLAVPLLVALAMAAFIDGQPSVVVDYSGMGETLRTFGAGAGCAMLLGLGLGAVTLSTPLSIVLVLTVPLVFDSAVSFLPRGIGAYLSSATFASWGAGGGAFEPSVVTSLLLWYVVPVGLGFVRYVRAEIS